MAAGIFIDEGERRAGNIVFFGDTQAFCQTLHKGGLTASEITGQSDDDRLMDSGAQRLSHLLGFCYGMGRYLDVFVSHGLQMVIGYSLFVKGIA